jgi:hypothetical protein
MLLTSPLATGSNSGAYANGCSSPVASTAGNCFGRSADQRWDQRADAPFVSAVFVRRLGAVTGVGCERFKPYDLLGFGYCLAKAPDIGPGTLSRNDRRHHVAGSRTECRPWGSSDRWFSASICWCLSGAGHSNGWRPGFLRPCRRTRSELSDRLSRGRVQRRFHHCTSHRCS